MAEPGNDHPTVHVRTRAQQTRTWLAERARDTAEDVLRIVVGTWIIMAVDRLVFELGWSFIGTAVVLAGVELVLTVADNLLYELVHQGRRTVHVLTRFYARRRWHP